MRLTSISFLASIYATAALADTQPVKILIEPDVTTPTTATASLTFGTAQSLTLLAPRHLQQNSERLPFHVVCDGVKKTVAPDETEMSCRQLQWPVVFQNTRTTPYALANQQNLYSPTGWWSLTEWDDIPQFHGIDAIEVCGKSREGEAKCASLPTKNEPPLILTWGKFEKTLTTGQTTLTLFKDDPAGALKEENLPALQPQFEYLQEVLTTERATPEEVDLVWVAIDKNLRQVAGAAGTQAFLANFAITDGATTDDDINKLHWVSAHELFHLLANQPYPLWVSESLAQYYGYKSLEKAGLQTQTPMEQWQGFKEHYPHAATGLYEAHKKVTRENDHSYYPLVYIKGAAFWQAVDQELEKAGTSLDKFLPQLTSAAPNNPVMSSTTIDLLQTTLSEKAVSALQQQYLN